MLKTPLGDIIIKINNSIIDYEATKVLSNLKRFPQVDDVFSLRIRVPAQMKIVKVECFLANFAIESFHDTGEWLEAISFYDKGLKLTIGMEADFSYEYLYGERYSMCDFIGDITDRGLEILCDKNINYDLIFGVAWLHDVNDANDSQTWYAADPHNHNLLD